ncbi:DUF1465 family protein [uncultured Sneathiella sp.]|jgi:regulator of CtrA degradation|uniref:DUF1465 family protein n=1 Tax=uncultured Sneathiella sp. TaxID=879315 RepID=UPI0030D716BC|tara:strand:- start:3063 stop:3509 length:447 start_codon:yes stop_codon:yes gene_type:complete
MSVSGNDQAVLKSETIFFTRTYDEALDLVREARTYLAGRGKEDVRNLPVEANFGYAAESLRLTTRLTEGMAWLLYQRALQEGEITLAEAQEEECHLQHLEICLPEEATCDPAILPEGLQSLLERSERLYQRLLRLDQQGRDAFRRANP